MMIIRVVAKTSNDKKCSIVFYWHLGLNYHSYHRARLSYLWPPSRQPYRYLLSSRNYDCNSYRLTTRVCLLRQPLPISTHFHPSPICQALQPSIPVDGDLRCLSFGSPDSSVFHQWWLLTSTFPPLSTWTSSYFLLSRLDLWTFFRCTQPLFVYFLEQCTGCAREEQEFNSWQQIASNVWQITVKISLSS